MTYPVYAFYHYPSKAANYLSCEAALLLMLPVLILLVSARVLVGRTQRDTEGRA